MGLENYVPIDISILMLTYNHESFIRQALDSVLCQQTDYNYEIVIGDDKSLDRTRNILLEYKEKHGDKIRLILRDENIGATKNMYDGIMCCRGRYIAFLEGDDFWTSPLKLQTQVSYLENHPQYIATVHSVAVYCADPQVNWTRKSGWYCKKGSIYTFESFKKRRFASHTSAMVLRNNFTDSKNNYEIIYKADNMTADRTFTLILVAQGDIYCFESIMSTYRLVISDGASNVNSLYKNKNVIYTDWEYECKLNDYCRREFGKEFLGRHDIARRWTQATKRLVLKRKAQDKAVFLIFTRLICKDFFAIFYIPIELVKIAFSRVQLLYSRIMIKSVMSEEIKSETSKR